METLRKQKKNLKKEMKSATEEEKNEQRKIRKGETKSKEKEPGTLLQRPISICNITLQANKIMFPFDTERTAGDPPEENTI